MKKTYEKPELQTEPFDVEDVITASGGLLHTLAQTFSDSFETLTENIGELFGSFNSDP